MLKHRLSSVVKALRLKPEEIKLLFDVISGIAITRDDDVLWI